MSKFEIAFGAVLKNVSRSMIGTALALTPDTARLNTMASINYLLNMFSFLGFVCEQS
jgi:hypothetical protein